MAVSPERISALIEAELSQVQDSRAIDHVRGLLVRPFAALRSNRGRVL